MKEYKILQLNAWTGRIKGALLEFIQKNDFDIICLQEAIWADDNETLEIFSATVEKIKEASKLKYESRADNWIANAFNTKIYQGNAILSREKIIEEQIELVYGEEKVAETAQDLLNHYYKAQLVKLESGLNIVNYHGYWLPTPIGDETTTDVMRKVAKIARNAKGPLVMCGDLNIIYDSPAMRELDFLQDLTHKHNIDNTLVGLKFNGKVPCDHILINNQVEVTDFSVLNNIISDHKPLSATIKIKESSNNEK